MDRRSFLKSCATLTLGTSLARPALAQDVTVRWWYHFDDPQKTPAELIAKFEAQNPGIRIRAEAIPWGGGTDYMTRIFAALVAGTAPDCGQVRLLYQPRLMQMRALEPLDKYLAEWQGRSDIAENFWKINQSGDGHQYYLPLHYVIIYLYYRTDLFAAAKLQPPQGFEDFLTAAQTLTRDGIYGYGMRGGIGCFDNWGPFVLGAGGSFDKGGLVNERALAANRWFTELATKHKVVPPSAPTDSMRQIVDAFKAGRTAMAIHHIGSAAEIVAVLGDKVSAVPVPRAPDGHGWTYFGDESNAIFASSKVKEAAFRWISFLSSGENNVELVKLTGQLPVTTSGAKDWHEQPRRFLDASTASVPYGSPLPDSPRAPELIGRLLPTNLQRVLVGELPPDDMMRTLDRFISG